jgi:trehalose 6-phosphate phosphatase
VRSATSRGEAIVDDDALAPTSRHAHEIEYQARNRVVAKIKMHKTHRPSAVSPGAAPDWALFPDVDRSLVHLRETPDGVNRSDRVCQILEQIMVCLGGAIALVSRRTIQNLDELLMPSRFPVAGLHGLERRDAQAIVHSHSDSKVLDALRPPLMEVADTHKGVKPEDKSRALAIHYRQAPDRATRIQSLVEDLVRPLAHELHVIHGKMVSEIKPWHADKGSAIGDFMIEPPFKGRVPVFIGDDTTDEDGFAFINQMNGYAIRVGDDVDTAARYGPEVVDEVIAWLEDSPSSL